MNLAPAELQIGDRIVSTPAGLLGGVVKYVPKRSGLWWLVPVSVGGVQTVLRLAPAARCEVTR